MLSASTTRVDLVEPSAPLLAHAVAALDRRSIDVRAHRCDVGTIREGVREYRPHPDVVSGFLMPVLVGQLDPARARYTYEQPAAAWAGLAEEAGFATSMHRVAEYWWADAILISARSSVMHRAR